MSLFVSYCNGPGPGYIIYGDRLITSTQVFFFPARLQIDLPEAFPLSMMRPELNGAEGPGTHSCCCKTWFRKWEEKYLTVRNPPLQSRQSHVRPELHVSCLMRRWLPLRPRTSVAKRFSRQAACRAGLTPRIATVVGPSQGGDRSLHGV